MQHKSSHELHRRELHKLDLTVILVIAVSERDGFFIHCLQTVIVNSGLMSIAAYILHYMMRRFKRPFAVNDPIFHIERID